MYTYIQYDTVISFCTDAAECPTILARSAGQCKYIQIVKYMNPVVYYFVNSFRADLLDYLAFLEYQYKQQQEEEQPLLEQEQQKQGKQAQSKELLFQSI